MIIHKTKRHKSNGTNDEGVHSRLSSYVNYQLTMIITIIINIVVLLKQLVKLEAQYKMKVRKLMS